MFGKVDGSKRTQRRSWRETALTCRRGQTLQIRASSSWEGNLTDATETPKLRKSLVLVNHCWIHTLPWSPAYCHISLKGQAERQGRERTRHHHCGQPAQSQSFVYWGSRQAPWSQGFLSPRQILGDLFSEARTAPRRALPTSLPLPMHQSRGLKETAPRHKQKAARRNCSLVSSLLCSTNGPPRDHPWQRRDGTLHPGMEQSPPNRNRAQTVKKPKIFTKIARRSANKPVLHFSALYGKCIL